MSDQTAFSSEFRSLRAQHLAMIQATISRMAGNSAAAKSFALALAAAIISFVVAAKAPFAAFTGIFVVSVLAWLDAYYLCIERAYRRLFDDVRKEASGLPPDFRLSIEADDVSLKQTLKACGSTSITLPYGVTILALIIAGIFTGA